MRVSININMYTFIHTELLCKNTGLNLILAMFWASVYTNRIFIDNKGMIITSNLLQRKLLYNTRWKY